DGSRAYTGRFHGRQGRSEAAPDASPSVKSVIETRDGARPAAVIRRHSLRAKIKTLRSEFLDPRPQLHLPGPGAPRLAQKMHIGGRDRVGSEQAVGLVRRLRTALGADAAV